MNYFILQSALLILVAYFLGSIIGCWLRKMFTESASMLHRESEELPATGGVGAGTVPATVAAGAGAIASTRLAGSDGEASIKINRPETPSEPYVEVPEPIREPDVALPVSIPDATPVVPRETFTYVEPEPLPEPDIPEIRIAEPEPEAPAPAEPEIVEKVVVEEPGIAVPPQRVAVPVIDDLTKIKGVGLPIALELKKLGVTRFEHVANWSSEDVAEISRKCGFTGRIERENWMDQAKILASGDELAFTTHQLKASDAGSRSPRTAYSRSSRFSGDDLQRVGGIAPADEKRLNEMGISRFSQIAAWSDDDIAAVCRQLGFESTVELENWVEQARKLKTREV